MKMESSTKQSIVWSVLLIVLQLVAIGWSALFVVSCRSMRSASASSHLDSLEEASTEYATLAWATEAIAGDSVDLKVSLSTMSILPEGASYVRKSGRTQLSLSRDGDNIVATATTDSAPRQVRYYSRLARDSLRRSGQSTREEMTRTHNNGIPCQVPIAIFVACVCLLPLLLVHLKNKQ